ncbi:MAG TPA: hypothetical protein VF677_06025 [Flavobacterium sp.]|jgi:tetratricopeptide (TPR) repeat protein
MKHFFLITIIIFSITTVYAQTPELLIVSGIEKKNNGDIKGAIVEFSKAIKISPKANYYYFRADAKNRINDYYGALADSNKAIGLSPSTSVFYFIRGYSKHMLKKYNDAILDYTKSISLCKNEDENAENYLMRGLSKINISQKNEACLDFSKAGELGNEKSYNLIEKYCSN